MSPITAAMTRRRSRGSSARRSSSESIASGAERALRSTSAFAHLRQNPPACRRVSRCRLPGPPGHRAAAGCGGDYDGAARAGLNLCDPDPHGSVLQIVSGLAFRFKNLVRTLGLVRLAGLNHLTGTGMALPWSLVERVKLADGNVVEDMQLGIDLALAGTPPLFLPEARVDSPLPQQKAAATTQRTRWEHGHLKTLLTQDTAADCIVASSIAGSTCSGWRLIWPFRPCRYWPSVWPQQQPIWRHCMAARRFDLPVAVLVAH